MIERACTFGSHDGLVGIMTEPAVSVRRADAPAVVFSNVGLNHRVAPGRLFVELARRLAAAGFVSLRFNLSGFGDSEPRRTGGTDLERAALDTREALDFLQKKGVRRFVLVGFCSGVDSAHAVALADPRVAGAVFIEGYAYRNAGFWLRYLTVRNLQPERWKRYIRQRWARIRDGRAIARAPEIFGGEGPTRAQFAADLARLAERSVEMLFVYTVVSDNLYNYKDQFYETFGYRDRIDVEYYTRADHVFSTDAHRDRLLDRTIAWIIDRFPASHTENGAMASVRHA